MTPDQLVTVLRGIRLPVCRSEAEVRAHIDAALDAAGVGYWREVKLGRGCRVDYLVDGGIVLEAKRGKPNSRAVAAQVERYARHPTVTAVVIVVDRNLARAPLNAAGKPVHYVALNKQWGIAT